MEITFNWENKPVKLSQLSPEKKYESDFWAAYKLKYNVPLAKAMEIGKRHKAVINHQYKLGTNVSKLVRIIDKIEKHVDYNS